MLIRVVGNLPYNISTPLLVHLFSAGKSISDMHFMLQKEVVARMAAAPGSRTYGRLSLLCQLHSQVTPLFDVPPQAFSPVPRVDSTFVRLAVHREPPVQITDRAVFDRLVSSAFAQRRKTLRNSLKALVSPEMFDAVGIDSGLRAEALGLEDYAALAEVVANLAPESADGT
jgi:16S rRNA (adenine1518-N6/adenine1519-N6)-dimethyltransferase